MFSGNTRSYETFFFPGVKTGRIIPKIEPMKIRGTIHKKKLFVSYHREYFLIKAVNRGLGV